MQLSDFGKHMQRFFQNDIKKIIRSVAVNDKNQVRETKTGQ